MLPCLTSAQEITGHESHGQPYFDLADSFRRRMLSIKLKNLVKDDEGVFCTLFPNPPVSPNKREPGSQNGFVQG